jgi:hypothetical protein
VVKKILRKVILGSVTSHPVLSYVVAREMPVLASPRSCVAWRCMALNIVKKRGRNCLLSQLLHSHNRHIFLDINDTEPFDNGIENL